MDKLRKEFEEMIETYCCSDDCGTAGVSFDDVWSWIETAITKAMEEEREKIENLIINEDNDSVAVVKVLNFLTQDKEK